jgi:hypothetical protein
MYLFFQLIFHLPEEVKKNWAFPDGPGFPLQSLRIFLRRAAAGDLRCNP